MSTRQLELALRIKALIEGVGGVEGLNDEIEHLTKQAGHPLPDPTKGIGEGAEHTAEKLTNLDGVTKKVTLALKAMAGAATVYEFLQANQRAEALHRALVQLTGSEEAAAAQTQWLKDTANELGVAVADVSGDYIGLTAASKGTNLEGEQTDRVFKAIVGSMTALGKSGAETSRAVQAVSQMMSKGVVSAEELRMQLGEALPGTMQAAAEALGVPQEKLADLIATGSVVSDQFLPKLATALENKFGVGKTAVNTFTAEVARMRNAMNETFEFIGNSGVMSALAEGASIAAYAITGVTQGIDSLGKKIGAMAAFVSGALSFDELVAEFGKIDTAAEATLAKIAAHSDLLRGSIEQTNQAARDTAGAVETAAAAAGTIAAKSREAADAAGTQAASYYAVSAALATVKEQTAQWVAQADAGLKVALAEAEAEDQLAALYDARALKLSAAAASTQQRAEAQAAHAAVLRDAAAAEANYAAALAASAAAQDVTSEAQRKAIKAAEDKATASRQAAEAAEQEAESAKIAAAQAALAAESAKDNSDRIGELAHAYETAQAALDA